MLLAIAVAAGLINTGDTLDLSTVSLKNTALGISILTGIVSFLTGVATLVADAFSPERERLHLGSGDPLARFRKHFAQLLKAVERPILVVIDDIDRCKPEFIVELTRGLQTILTSSRVIYLILGDRNWIEQAFDVVNHDMSNIDVGPEHSFGGRFVEKAIQLSFVLPDISDQQETYVREVLLGREASSSETSRKPLIGPPGEPTGSQNPAESAYLSQAEQNRLRSETRKQVREKLSGKRKLEEIDQSGIELESASASADAYTRPTIREEVILRRAASRDQVQQAIGHRLQSLASYLPSNPRHIKRIINAIAMYQDSILLTGGSFKSAGFGETRWWQLVIGVVLMMGYPKSWAALSADPSIADILIANEEYQPDEDDERSVMIEKMQQNTDLVQLLRGQPSANLANGESGDEKGAAQTRLSKETIIWLNRVIPA